MICSINTNLAFIRDIINQLEAILSTKFVYRMYVDENQEDDFFVLFNFFFSEITVKHEPFYPINKLKFLLVSAKWLFSVM